MLDRNLNESYDAGQQANLLVHHITKACNAAMSKKKRKPPRETQHIGRTVKSTYYCEECHKSRRQFQWSIGSVVCMRLREMFKKKKKTHRAEKSDKKRKIPILKNCVTK